MRILKFRLFHKWTKREGITDKALIDAIHEIDQKLFEANLGGDLYKKRIARKGHGKRGSYRTIIAFKRNDRAIFMYGFAKNERENMSIKEIIVYKKLAGYYLEINDIKLKELIMVGELIEVSP